MTLTFTPIAARWAIVVLSAALAVERTASAQRVVRSETTPGKPRQRSMASKPAAHDPTTVIETANFRIYGISALNEAEDVADDLESLRNSLVKTWLAGSACPRGRPSVSWSSMPRQVVTRGLSAKTRSPRWALRASIHSAGAFQAVALMCAPTWLVGSRRPCRTN